GGFEAVVGEQEVLDGVPFTRVTSTQMVGGECIHARGVPRGSSPPLLLGKSSGRVRSWCLRVRFGHGPRVCTPALTSVRLLYRQVASQIPHVDAVGGAVPQVGEEVHARADAVLDVQFDVCVHGDPATGVDLVGDREQSLLVEFATIADIVRLLGGQAFDGYHPVTVGGLFQVGVETEPGTWVVELVAGVVVECEHRLPGAGDPQGLLAVVGVFVHRVVVLDGEEQVREVRTVGDAFEELTHVPRGTRPGVGGRRRGSQTVQSRLPGPVTQPPDLVPGGTQFLAGGTELLPQVRVLGEEAVAFGGEFLDP